MKSILKALATIAMTASLSGHHVIERHPAMGSGIPHPHPPRRRRRVGRIKWKNGLKSRPLIHGERRVNLAQIARCEANALRREPMFKEQDKARREAIAARRVAPFVALATRCGRQAFHISNNGAHKP